MDATDDSRANPRGDAPSAVERPHPSHTPVNAVVFAATHPDRCLVAVRSLLDRTDLAIHVGVLYNDFGRTFTGLDPRVSWRPVGSVSELVNSVHHETRGHVLVVDDAVVLPPDPLAMALRWLEDDLRVATVSFLSNAADFLSFPTRNLPVDRPPEGHDEITITGRLRALDPPPLAAPIAHAAGAVVLISSVALGAVGELEAPVSARFDIAIADFSARARAKGFVDLLDSSTFYARPSDVAIWPTGHTITPDDRGWLLHRHQSLVAFLDHERFGGDSPMAMAHQVARVKLEGLRILVDGSCFGPHEVGTQVATRHTIRALAARDDVASVTVALPGPLPHYAAELLTSRKVDAKPSTAHEPHRAGPADIAFRPYQPVPGWELERWRHAGVRLVVSMLDVIAFHNGGYFSTTGEWLDYRRVVDEVTRRADGLTVISQDVADQMRLQGLPFESDRLGVVPLGTDHLTGTEAARIPAELLARGFAVGEFALCLGTNYTHKNRELALLAHRELHRRGFDLALVFVGTAVPHGTSRAAEARYGAVDGRTYVLPEVVAEERNWLLRHASLLWFPTSAEGFGIPPFEAARFGTPPVMVGFGPLRELCRPERTARSAWGPDVPLLAGEWTPGSLADVAEALLRDPDLARRHVDALLGAADRWTWDDTAAGLTSLFRSLLARPRR